MQLASGHYVAVFPGTPTALETDDVEYTVSETAPRGLAPSSLDEAVDSGIESTRALHDASSRGHATATDVSRTTGDFEGVETRRVTYRLTPGDVTIDGLLFYRDGALVSASVVQKGAADPAPAYRFVSSLKSHAG